MGPKAFRRTYMGRGRRIGGARRPAAALAVLLAAGCAKPSPDFIARTLQDCRAGDPAACELLSDLEPAPVLDTPKPPPRRLSPTQRDVDAILEGMRRARNTPTPRPPQPPPPSAAQPDGAPPP